VHAHLHAAMDTLHRVNYEQRVAAGPEAGTGQPPNLRLHDRGQKRRQHPGRKDRRQQRRNSRNVDQATSQGISAAGSVLPAPALGDEVRALKQVFPATDEAADVVYTILVRHGSS
jgi:hypothetical protein